MIPIKQILVLEDCLELREDLVIELREAGLVVIEAASGAEFREKIGAHSPDILLCDVQLPDANGISLVEEMGIDLSNKNPPQVIFISAFSDSVLRTRALETGAYAFLVKPVDYGQLLALISDALE